MGELSGERHSGGGFRHALVELGFVAGPEAWVAARRLCGAIKQASEFRPPPRLVGSCRPLKRPDLRRRSVAKLGRSKRLQPCLVV